MYFFRKRILYSGEPSIFHIEFGEVCEPVLWAILGKITDFTLLALMHGGGGYLVVFCQKWWVGIYTGVCVLMGEVFILMKWMAS
jgi:hypothetical protein